MRGGRAIGPLVLLLAACAGERPLVQAFRDGGWQPEAFRLVSLTGHRDGTGAVFSLRLEGTSRLLVEGSLEVDPQARLVDGRWREEGGSRDRSGSITGASLRFTGGQGGRPGLGGQFLLAEGGAPAYRVNLPVTILERGVRGSGEGEPETYGSWMARDPEDWPRIALVNAIEYTDSEHPSAACGFLVEVGDQVLAATAKHVLTYFRSSAMDSVSFRDTLVSWRMFPKDSPEDAAVVGRLLNEDRSEPLERIPSSRDWLLFTLHSSTNAVQPLRLRSTPLEEGETVHVIGWRYPDEGRQRVHPGHFARLDEGSVLISVDALADNTVPGLSGAPVIDARGYVVGLMSTKSGKLQRLAPAAYARQVLEQQPVPRMP